MNKKMLSCFQSSADRNTGNTDTLIIDDNSIVFTPTFKEDIVFDLLDVHNTVY
jgi:hypothetical protein